MEEEEVEKRRLLKRLTVPHLVKLLTNEGVKATDRLKKDECMDMVLRQGSITTEKITYELNLRETQKLFNRYTKESDVKARLATFTEGQRLYWLKPGVTGVQYRFGVIVQIKGQFLYVRCVKVQEEQFEHPFPIRSYQARVVPLWDSFYEADELGRSHGKVFGDRVRMAPSEAQLFSDEVEYFNEYVF